MSVKIGNETVEQLPKRIANRSENKKYLYKNKIIVWKDNLLKCVHNYIHNRCNICKNNPNFCIHDTEISNCVDCVELYNIQKKENKEKLLKIKPIENTREILLHSDGMIVDKILIPFIPKLLDRIEGNKYIQSNKIITWINNKFRCEHGKRDYRCKICKHFKNLCFHNNEENNCEKCKYFVAQKYKEKCIEELKLKIKKQENIELKKIQNNLSKKEKIEKAALEIIQVKAELSTNIKKIDIRNRQGLTGEYLLVDEIDYDRVNALKWNFHDIKRKSVKSSKLPIGHLIIGKPDLGYVVDHIDGNPLNNTKSNLRFLTHKENAQNKKKKIGSTSKFYGVYWAKQKNKWIAKHSNNRLYFNTELEAAKQYDKFVLYYIGLGSTRNHVLLEEEIKDALKNVNKPVPRKNKIQGIRYNPKNNKFYVYFEWNKKYISLGKSFDTRETAEVACLEKRSELLKIKQDEHKAKPITYNKEGIAYIEIEKNNKEIIHILVDSEHWHDLTSTSMSCTNLYASIRRNDKGIDVHVYLYNKVYGDKKVKTNFVDHINGDKNDNRVQNLREATQVQNSHNRKKQIGCTSKYIGVYKKKSEKKYRVRISISGKYTQIGTFECEIEAAKCYNEAAILEYGDFANVNKGPEFDN